MKRALNLIAALLFVATAHPLPAQTAAQLDSRTREALSRALDDERHAQALYQAVMDRHGRARPFANILRAEQRHEAALLPLFKKYGLPVPENRWKEKKIEVPTALAECCQLGIEAEKANIAMYDGFLKFVQEPDIRQAFTYLRNASKNNHLPAFERCAAGRGLGPGPGRGQGYGPGGPSTRLAQRFAASWEAANGPYKRALQATSLGRAEEGLRFLSAFRTAWQVFRAAYADSPPIPYARDSRWASDLAEVAAWIETAERQIRAGEVQEAHETLEQVRMRWLAVRERNGVDYFGDHLIRFHEPMEKVALAVKGKTPDMLTDAELGAIRAALPELKRLWRPIAEAEATGLTPERAAERRRRIDALARIIQALDRAVAANDWAAILASGTKLKPAFVPLYMQFG